MASAVISASKGPHSSRDLQSTMTRLSSSGHPTSESSAFSCHTDSVPKSMPSKDTQDPDEMRENNQHLPSTFEIKIKKDKGSSTSSPLKVWRATKCIQPSTTSTTPLPVFSLGTDSVAQSPCTYQEKLLKERLNIQGNPELEQKPLIHPKFLASPIISQNNEKGNLFNTNAIKTSPNRVYPETKPVPPVQTYLKDENLKQLEDSLSRNISKYSESDKKHLKAKMKAYSHMKKHILNYESQETNIIEINDMRKKSQDKSKIRTIKHKPDCPKCQIKSPPPAQDQTQGKSFHIQAYKAYKNKTNISVDKQDARTVTQRDQVSEDLNKNQGETVSNQNSMHFLKPCEEAIAFYETSKNPKMTSSYPMASQEKKMKKKSYPINELCKRPLTEEVSSTLLNTHLNPSMTKSCEAKERNSRDNILALTSGVFYDSECCRVKNNPVISVNNIPTNDLSHPTSVVLSYDAVSGSQPVSFNVPTTSTRNSLSMSTSTQNKRHSNGSGLTSNNILKIPKEELFDHGKSCPIRKDFKDVKKMTTKSNESKECMVDNGSKPMNSKRQVISDSAMQKQTNPSIEDDNGKNKNEESFLSDKDYFDYKYRLCYVDCNKLDADSAFCASCSGEENTTAKGNISDDKLFQSFLRYDDANNNKNSANTKISPHENNGRRPFGENKAQIEIKSSIELDNWLSTIGSSSIAQSKHSEKESKDKSSPSNISSRCGKCCITQKSNFQCVSSQDLTSSSPINGWADSSVHSMHNYHSNNKCSLLDEAPRQMCTTNNRYNRHSSTLETFSPFMSQPIFSVLPFEAYRVDGQLPTKNENASNKKPNENEISSKTNCPLTNSQDDVIARRALKQRMRPKESSRLSTCSMSSVNEIHILQVPNPGGIQCPVESNTSKHVKDGPLPHKNGDPSTLQVRYIPKQQCGLSRPNKVQTTAHAQIKSGSNSNGVNGSINPLASSRLEGCPSSNQPKNTRQINTSPFPSFASQPQTHRSSPGISSQMVQSGHNQTGLSAPGMSGPDLLQVSVIQPGTPARSDSLNQSSPTPPKKPSFFSRFTLAPLSIFYKEAKSNGSK